MSTLNKLKTVVESYRVTTETKTKWTAAVPPETELTLLTHSRRIKYTTTRYEGGNYVVAKAKVDELEKNINITDINLNEYEAGTYIVTATLQETDAWGDWY